MMAEREIVERFLALFGIRNSRLSDPNARLKPRWGASQRSG
jgi:hypothetical protein